MSEPMSLEEAASAWAKKEVLHRRRERVETMLEVLRKVTAAWPELDCLYPEIAAKGEELARLVAGIEELEAGPNRI